MPPYKLKFTQLANHFAVCRFSPGAGVPAWATFGPFTSITRTADELSIVCPLQNVPAERKPETPWTCFKLEGSFDFLQTGVLASFIDPLAASGVPIFAISTYDTDYVLVREEYAGAAMAALQEAGHELTG